MTQRQQKNYRPVIKDTEYLLHFTRPVLFFGLKTIWCSNIKVNISDPTRTVVDLMNNMALGGGLRSSVNILMNYLNSEKKSIELLIDYMRVLGKGAAYKRLGFLIEKHYPEESRLIKICLAGLTTGNAKLDPALDCKKLITRWRLWVPQHWTEK